MAHCGRPAIWTPLSWSCGRPAEEREHDVLDEDAARVSPLKHANLNEIVSS